MQAYISLKLPESYFFIQNKLIRTFELILTTIYSITTSLVCWQVKWFANIKSVFN